MPYATKSVHIIQKRKDPRLTMTTVTHPKAKILVDKTIELAMIALTDEQKATARRLYKSGESISAIARILGVSRATVRRASTS